MKLKGLSSLHRRGLLLAFVLLLLSPSLLRKISSLLEPKKELYLASCYLLDEKFEIIKQLSSHWICEVKADGGWLGSNNTELVNFGPDGEVLWRKKGEYHHQIRLWDEKSVIVIFGEPKKIGDQLVKFDSIQRLDLQDGKVLSEFSIYNEIYLTRKLKGSQLDIAPQPVPSTSISFRNKVSVEKTHLNSVTFYNNKIVVNDHFFLAFLLNENLEFDGFLDIPFSADPNDRRRVHDLKMLGKDHFLFFRNSAKPTYNLIEVKNGKIVFQFPKDPKDFFTVRCCGGVEKGKDHYLFAVPGRKSDDYFSIVGLVSHQGKWLVRNQIPTRVQDIRKVPYSDFLENNKIR